jgi:hypothetical protein
MSCVLITSRLLATLAFVGFAGAAFAADPPPHPVPLAAVAQKPAPSCGGLPRGGRAYKDCIDAQSRRDTAPGSPPVVMPVFSSR